MKKIIIGVLILSITLVGVFSVAASGNKTETIGSKDNISNMNVSDDDKLNKKIDIEKLNTQKDNIFNNILNCVDYYDKISGTFETSFIDNSPTIVSYEVNIPEQISLQIVKGNNIDLKVLSKDNKIIEANNKEKKYIEHKFISQYNQIKRNKKTSKINEEVKLEPFYNRNKIDVSKERVRKNSSGEMEFYYRTDLTNASFAATSIYPQSIVFGFLSEKDSWAVKNVEKYLNREVMVISGETADSEYANKLNVYSYEMRIDINSGVLLDFKGYDTNDKITHYLTTTKIKIDENNNDFEGELDTEISSIKKSYSKK